MERQALTGNDGEGIFAGALHPGDDEKTVAVADGHLAGFAGLLRQPLEMRLRQGGEVEIVGIGDGAGGKRQETRPEPIAAVGGPSHHVMELQRVEDAVDGRPRQAEPIDKVADGGTASALLEEKQDVHHPVDDRDAVLGNRLLGRDVAHEGGMSPIDEVRSLPLTSKNEHGKFTFE